MRLALVAALVVGCAAGAVRPAFAQADSAWWQHDSAARLAYRAGDFAAYRAQLLAQRREIGAAPRLDYGLAVAESRLGNDQRALEWLEVFADMGVWRDASHDADLAPVRALPGYQRVAMLLAANRTPIARGAVAFTLADADLIAEDIAYDSVGRRFFVSSVHRGTIVAADSTGHASPFVQPGAGGSGATWGMFALAVDPVRRLLWATTIARRAGAGWTAAYSGRSALLAYDLATGAVRSRVEPPPTPGGHALGDMTLGADGTVYVSNAAQGTVYVLTPGATALAALVPAGTFRSPQTPALSADGRRLFVADYSRGVAAIDLAARRVAWLAHPGNVAMTGIDGLYRVGAALIAVQNGTTPERVLRLLLDAPMTRILGADVLERGTPVLDDPTHGVMVGDAFYFIARSGWSRVRDDGSLRPAGPDNGPLIRRILLR